MLTSITELTAVHQLKNSTKKPNQNNRQATDAITSYE
jgi:hypothetical protein